MERKDFIEQVGLSGAAILIFGCMQGCSKSDGTTTNNNGNNNNATVDFTIDISKSPYDALKNIGGFYVEPITNVIVVKTTASEIIAVSAICTHQQASITYQANNNRFYCAAHGSVFSTTGAVTTGPATAALKKYQTTLTGTVLRVFA
ncbi:MAG: Rieske (2Fe-2S) protein [Chitinophagia bacterium]|mgnify:FL=1|jgi:cytochrome b6-f complex iron-sulfur subunit|nr:Rieske (2Fe-2S) protein [Chitinophagia bacterium]